MTTFGDLFTPRQLVALTTFSDLVQEARERVQRDALAAGLPDDGKPLRDGGTGATPTPTRWRVSGVRGRADWLTTGTRLCIVGQPTDRSVANTFARQAIPMTWDFAEANPLSGRRRQLL